VPHVVVAEVVRSGLAESVHCGSVVALAADGSVEFAIGDVTSPMFPRSANKPIQAAAMLARGLDLPDELIALVAASHSGEPFHRDGVLRILATAGLSESSLQNTPGWPIDQQEAVSYVRAGGQKTSIAADCSGKHAGMLVTCAVNDWPLESYCARDHPLQRAIAVEMEDLAGEAVAHTGVDGCGAPLFAVSLTGLATAFRSLAASDSGTARRRVVDAIQRHPEWTSGTRRDEAQLIRGVPGLYGKGGAEGVYAVALEDGRAVALKIADGQQRARPVVMAAALRRLGIDAPVISELSYAPVLGHGEPVGEIRAALFGQVSPTTR
jgi:L-asparaginase II